ADLTDVVAEADAERQQAAGLDPQEIVAQAELERGDAGGIAQAVAIAVREVAQFVAPAGQDPQRVGTARELAHAQRATGEPHCRIPSGEAEDGLVAQGADAAARADRESGVDSGHLRPEGNTPAAVKAA